MEQFRDRESERETERRLSISLFSYCCMQANRHQFSLSLFALLLSLLSFSISLSTICVFFLFFAPCRTLILFSSSTPSSFPTTQSTTYKTCSSSIRSYQFYEKIVKPIFSSFLISVFFDWHIHTSDYSTSNPILTMIFTLSLLVLCIHSSEPWL